MENNQSLKGLLHSLRIIFFALIMGQMFFGGAILFVVSEMGFVQENPSALFRYLPIALTFVLAVSSGIVRQQLLVKAMEKKRMVEKMEIYRSTMIVTLAMLEGAGLINIIFYLFSGEWLNMALLIGVLAIFFRYYPSIERIARDLHLSEKETAALKNQLSQS